MSQPASNSHPITVSDSNDVGICSVCAANYKIVGSSGLVRKHGHGHGRQPCLGSGKLIPRATQPSSSNVSVDQSIDPALIPDATEFDISAPFKPTLRRIPRGARQKCAQAFNSRLRALLSAPSDLSCWKGVLQFAECLSQPNRGGKRHNLTSQVSTQIDRVVKGLAVQGTVTTDSSSQPSQGQSRKAKVTGTDGYVRRVSAKLQEGDIKGAVRCLCSEETLAPQTNATQQTLLLKHPSSPIDRRPLPSLNVLPMLVSVDEMKRSIRSFAPGSAGGKDGLRPQHLKDMTDDQVGGPLSETLAEFCNLVLAGGVPNDVRPTLFGASLFPFTKKDGGIRPIAVGLYT